PELPLSNHEPSTLANSKALAISWTASLPLTVLLSQPTNQLTSQTEGSVLTVLPGSTRSAGLGGAGVALVGEAGAMFANPAGIATIHHLSLEGSYEPYLAGTAVSAAALALRVSRWTWGVGAQALDYGSEPEIVPDPATGGRRGTPTGASFHPYEALATTSFVYRHGLAAFGVTGKYDRQQIGSAVSDAWAGDVGVAIAVFDIMAFGVSVQNLGGDLGNGALLPRRTRGTVGLTAWECDGRPDRARATPLGTPAEADPTDRRGGGRRWRGADADRQRRCTLHRPGWS